MGIVRFLDCFRRLGSVFGSAPGSFGICVLDSSFRIGSMKSSPFVFAAGTNIGDFLPRYYHNTKVVNNGSNFLIRAGMLDFGIS